MDDVAHTIILILHMLGASVIIGTSFVSLVVVLRPPITKDVINLLDRIWKIAGIAIGIQILTGLYLAFSEWDKVGSSPLFWIKMVLVFVVGGAVGYASKKEFENFKKDEQTKYNPSLSWIGLIVFAVVASIGVILVETL